MSSNKKKSALLAVRILTDIICVSLAWMFAYYLRFYSGIAYPKGLPPIHLYLKLIPFIVIIWFFVFSAAGFYKRSLVKRSAFLEAIDIFQSCILATLTFIAFTYFYAEFLYSRMTLVIFAITHPWMIISGRSIIRKIIRFMRRKAPPKGILLIGSGAVLQEAYGLAGTSDLEAFKIRGVILAGDPQQLEMGRQFCERLKMPLLKEPDNWIEFFKQQKIQSVIFALPNAAYSFLETHLTEISNQIPDVKVVPDLAQYSRFAAGIDMMNGIPFVNIHDSPLEGMGSVIKRMMDIAGALTALILLSPLLLAIAIAVKLSSSGPVFFLQERMGMDGKTFNCIKFRSMPVNTENKSGPVWAKSGESRATLVGKILRKFSLDEFPQFFNVLVGDMSLVGPRPERPVFVNEFRNHIPGYMLRHKVKSGITGWAQVNGWRGNTSIEKRIEHDLYYIQNWSIWMDLRILLLTVVEVIFSKNAY